MTVLPRTMPGRVAEGLDVFLQVSAQCKTCLSLSTQKWKCASPGCLMSIAGNPLEPKKKDPNRPGVDI